MVSFRKSKKFGPIRLTASKSGLAVSGGVPGARISANTKGQVRRTVGVPGTGIYDTKRIGGGKSTAASGQASSSGQNVEMSVADGTGGGRALLKGQKDVAYLQVVEVRDLPDSASLAGITTNAEGWARGIRDAILMPQGDEYRVIMLVQPEDNPGVFKGNETNAKGVDIGRIGKRDLDKYRTDFGGRNIQVVVYMDVSPQRTPHVEVRLKPEVLAASIASAAQEAAAVEAGWYADPEGEAVYRYWDGRAWTTHVSNGGSTEA